MTRLKLKLIPCLLAGLLLAGCQAMPGQPQTRQPEADQSQAGEARPEDTTRINTHPEEPEPYGRQADATKPCAVGPWMMEAPEGQMSKVRAWVVYRQRIDALDAAELPTALEEAERLYDERPDDLNRMRLGYLLSRSDAAPRQLSRGREVVGGISNTSELAPFRDSLDREMALLIRQDRDKARIDELQAQLEALTAQLEALKTIEEEMVENRENMEEEAQP